MRKTYTSYRYSPGDSFDHDHEGHELVPHRFYVVEREAGGAERIVDGRFFTETEAEREATLWQNAERDRRAKDARLLSSQVSGWLNGADDYEVDEFWAMWHPTLVATLVRALQRWLVRHGEDGRIPAWLWQNRESPTPHI
jgi:hypothetical protein